MIRKILRKVSSKKGESIAEVLIAGLIISLGALLLASMINASFRLLTNEEKSYKEFIEVKNDFELLNESKDSESSNITITTTNVLGVPKTINNRYVSVFSRGTPGNMFYRYDPNDLK